MTIRAMQSVTFYCAETPETLFADQGKTVNVLLHPAGKKSLHSLQILPLDG